MFLHTLQRCINNSITLKLHNKSLTNKTEEKKSYEINKQLLQQSNKTNCVLKKG